MTVERDVNIRLKVHGGREGKAFEDMAKGAKRVSEETRRAGSAVANMVKEMARSRDAGREIERVTKQLRTMGIAANEARTAATRLVREVGEGARVSAAHVQRLATGMKSLGQTGGGGGLFSRGGGAGGSEGIGGMMRGALPLAAAAGVARAVGGAAINEYRMSSRTSADEAIYQSIQNERGWSTGRAALGGIEGLRGIPLAGELLHGGVMSQVDRLTQQQREGAAQSQQRLTRQQQRTMRDREDRARREAEGVFRETQRRQAEDMEFGLGTESMVARLRGGRQVEDFRAGLRREDVGRQMQAEAEAIAGGGRMGGRGLAALRGEMGRAGQTAALSPEQARIDQERGRLQMQLQEARTTAARAGEGGAGANRTAEADALRRSVEIQQRLVQLEREGLTVRQQSSEARRTELGQLRDQARSQEEMYRQIAESERQRTRGLRERFGLMDEMQRRELLAVSESIRGGQRLTGEQEEVVLRNRDFFGDRAEQIAGGRAEQGGFGALFRNLNMDQRRQEAEQRQGQAQQLRLQLDNRIQAEITVNAEDIARQLADQLLPQIQQLTQRMLAELEGRITQESERVEVDRRQNAAANN